MQDATSPYPWFGIAELRKNRSVAVSIVAPPPRSARHDGGVVELIRGSGRKGRCVMEVQLGWFYQTRCGTVVRILGNDVDFFFALVLNRRPIDPWAFRVEPSIFSTPEDPNPLLILESGSWLHDLTAAWKPGDGILAERLKEAGRKGT